MWSDWFSLLARDWSMDGYTRLSLTTKVHSQVNMPRVKKCSNTSLDTQFGNEEVLGTINTMQPVYADNLGSDFDTDNMLDEMFPDKSQQVKTCPRCYETLLYDEVTTKKGDVWRYFRCPALHEYTKCFVACGADDVDVYLDKVKDTLHPIYVGGFDATHMRCYCNMSLILAMSKSEKNKYRQYFKCPKGTCNFFQWGDSEPVGRVRRWFIQGVNPDAKGKEQRHKPYDLAKPIQTRRSFEAHPRR